MGTSGVLKIFGIKNHPCFLTFTKENHVSRTSEISQERMVVKVELGKRKKIIQICCEECHHFTKNLNNVQRDDSKHTRDVEDIFTTTGSRKQRFDVLFVDKYKKT